MRTTLSSKGQIVLPVEIRERDALAAGDTFEVERVSRGEYRLVRRAPSSEGVLAWLTSCPVKGYFVPIEGESTDEL